MFEPVPGIYMVKAAVNWAALGKAVGTGAAKASKAAGRAAGAAKGAFREAAEGARAGYRGAEGAGAATHALEKAVPGAAGQGANINWGQTAKNVGSWFAEHQPLAQGGWGAKAGDIAGRALVAAPNAMMAYGDIQQGDYLSALGHGAAAFSGMRSQGGQRGMLLGSLTDTQQQLREGDYSGALLSGALAGTSAMNTGFLHGFRGLPGGARAVSRIENNPVMKALNSPVMNKYVMPGMMAYSGYQAVKGLAGGGGSEEGGSPVDYAMPRGIGMGAPINAHGQYTAGMPDPFVSSMMMNQRGPAINYAVSSPSQGQFGGQMPQGIDYGS